MPKKSLFRALGALGLLFPSLAPAAVFVNEIHYDDSTGTGDVGERVEVVATDGEDLTQYRIVLYNGSGGATYDDDALPTGSLVSCGATVRIATLSYATNGLQNGNPDGLALVGPGNAVLQFLSYEGTFAASNGPASGATSVDIGVLELNSTAPGTSLQLGGSGTAYADFAWSASAAETFGACNNGQTFVPTVDVPPTFVASAPAHTDSGVAFDVEPTITFSEPVTAGPGAFALNCGMGTPSFTVSASPATTFTLTPDAPLGFNKLCSLTVFGAEVLDIDGTADAMDGNQLIQFETESDDLPSVAATVPVDLAIDVARGANLSVTFSEPVDAPQSAFDVFCPDSAPMPLAKLVSTANDIAFTIDPTGDLPASTVCRLYVDNTQIHDQDGTADSPDRDHSITFTTAALAPPAVISTVPEKNATDFPPDGDLQVVFDADVTLSAGAFALDCATSTGISLTHAASGSSFTIGTGTVLDEGDTCTLHVEADAILSGDGLPPDADEDIAFTVSSTGPGNYYASVDDSSCSTLRTTLHALIDDHTAFPYSAGTTDTWDILEAADQDPLNTSRILEVYENVPYAKAGGGNTSYNREHTWPNSYGFNNLDGASGTVPQSSAYTDTHMLYLSDIEYNSNRGSKPYADCPQASGCSADVTQVYNGIGGGAVTYPGQHNWKQSDGSGEAYGSYEVWSARKGDMARAVLYMDIRYEGGTATGGNTTGQAEPDLVVTDDRDLIHSRRSTASGTAYMGLKSTLLAWHAADPPDEAEKQRNAVIQSFQGNRNPFIDHPEWAECLFNCTCAPADVTAVDDGYAVNEDATLTRDAAQGVLANDTDAQAEALTAQDASTPAHGSVTLNPDGSFTYVPVANYCGADQFTYTARDPSGDDDAAAVSITVTCQPDAPQITSATGMTLPENSGNGSAAGSVAANDPDGTVPTYTITGGNTGTAFAISAAGQITVANAAALNFETTPSFTLTVQASDGALSDSAQLTITLTNVEEGPAVANADAATVGEDSSNNAIAVLANDVADPDGGSNAVTAVGAASHGSTAFTAGGVTYTPAADYCGSDSFTYTLNGSFSATVNVTVTCANDAPIAQDALPARSGSEGEPIAAFSVAGGFADIDGDDLDYSQTGLPAGLTLDPETGAVSGVPAAGSGAGSPYTVTVTASDGALSVPQSFQFSVGLRPDAVFASGFEGS